MDDLKASKTERVLVLYTKLLNGQVVNKAQEALTYGVNERSNGLSGSVESGALAAVSFGVGRTLGESAKQAIIGHLGTIATDNIIKMVDMGVIGGLSILVFSVYQFTKLKLSGVATRQALVQVGKQALISLSVLAVSIAAQGVFGGAAGIIVATAAGLITVTYSAADAVHQRKFAERIRIYTIEQYAPYFV